MIHEIKKYVKRELKKGYSLPIIREELKHKGFSEEEINAAFYETTTPRISIMTLLVLVMGLIVMNALIMGVFVFLPLTASVPAAAKYLVLFLIPMLTGLLTFWIVSEAVVDSIEKNFAGIITPLPILLVLYDFLGSRTTIPALLPTLWYFIVQYGPFAQENIAEKNHPWKWLVVAASFLVVTVLVASMVHVTDLIRISFNP